jgi:hypothetical protein
MTALDYFRASPAEIADITVPKAILSASPQADASGWSQSDMKLARASANSLEVSVPSITIGGIEYKRALIMKRNPAEATIYHSTGVATYPLEQFSPDIQRQFGYDSNAADRYRKAQAEIQKQIAQEKTEASAQQDAQSSAQQVIQSSANYAGQSYDSDRVYVRGYYRKNGTYVHSYTRSR